MPPRAWEGMETLLCFQRYCVDAVDVPHVGRALDTACHANVVIAGGGVVDDDLNIVRGIFLHSLLGKHDRLRAGQAFCINSYHDDPF